MTSLKPAPPGTSWLVAASPGEIGESALDTAVGNRLDILDGNTMALPRTIVVSVEKGDPEQDDRDWTVMHDFVRDLAVIILGD